MDTMLDALQEGRLFELPDSEKKDALMFLAHIIEAFPEVPAGTDVVGFVMEREGEVSTALGKGWACPHARVPYDEDLMCVIGWSPTGIAYEAPDGQPVVLVVMYLVPENQRSHYLREISQLARALEGDPKVDALRQAKDLDDVRGVLLDLIEATKETTGPEARARMIRLQAKATAEVVHPGDLAALVVEPLLLVSAPGARPVALTQNPHLLEWVDSSSGIIAAVEAVGFYQNGGWRIIKRGSTSYQGGRATYDCIAIKIGGTEPR